MHNHEVLTKLKTFISETNMKHVFTHGINGPTTEYINLQDLGVILSDFANMYKIKRNGSFQMDIYRLKECIALPFNSNSNETCHLDAGNNIYIIDDDVYGIKYTEQDFCYEKLLTTKKFIEANHAIFEKQ